MASQTVHFYKDNMKTTDFSLPPNAALKTLHLMAVLKCDFNSELSKIVVVVVVLF